MTENDYPRLCGGTFFILVLQALRQRKRARAHVMEDRDGLSNPEVLMGLIKVFYPDYEMSNRELHSSKTNLFKTCQKKTFPPLNDRKVVDSFDERVQNDYKLVLDGMTKFVNTYIDLNEAVGKANLLVKALIELIKKDETISQKEVFYIDEAGQGIEKAQLSSLDNVYLPAFLLGVWHYVVVKRGDNTVGLATCNKWCPPPEVVGGPRNYIGRMGEGILDGLNVKLPTDKSVSGFKEDEKNDETIEPKEVNVIPQLHSQSQSEHSLSLNYDYFNFFVVGEEKYDYSSFIVPIDRVLEKGYMSDEIRARYKSLTPDLIEIIKTFPALFCSENHHYGKTDPNHMAYYGYVKDIKMQDNGVKIYFTKLNEIPQQTLIDFRAYFGISGNKKLNELDHTHWVIKRVNLVEELERIGYNFRL